MNTIDLAAMHSAVSAQRLAPFVPALAGLTEAEILRQTLARYLWNVALAQALYPVLSQTEVALRNSLYDAITTMTGDPVWFENAGILDPMEAERVEKAQQDLAGQGKDSHDPGRVVASLMFGFWTSLLTRRYGDPRTEPAKRLWPALLDRAFPYATVGLQKGQTRGIAQIRARFFLVKLLRDRVSHHEPIWRGVRPDQSVVALPQAYADTVEALGWLSPRLADAARAVGRFPDVHASGIQPFVELVSDTTIGAAD